MTFEDIRAKATPREARARICLNGALLAEHARLDGELQIGADSLGSLPDRRELAERVQALEQEIVEAEDEFLFRSIGYTAWLKLIAAHPPTPEQKRADPLIDHNALTFAPEAVAASAAEPEMTVADAQWLMDNAPLSEWRKVWDACLTVNLGSFDRPKSLTASAILRLNGTSSPTAGQGESLAASS